MYMINKETNGKSSLWDAEEKIRLETEARVKYFSLKDKKEIQNRIEQLDNEWDTERLLEINTGGVALAGAILGLIFNKKFFLLSGIAAGFLIQNSLQGWSPMYPFFRRLGIRTPREIENEKYALKAVKGDFKEASTEKDNLTRANKALVAVNHE